MKLCVALDLPSENENLAIAESLRSLDLWLKIGLRSFTRGGWEFVEKVRKLSGAPIFLDLKLYDIPNTISDAAEEIAKRGIEMFNIHASSGFKAMSRVCEILAKHEKRPIVLAVTALTSFSREDFLDIYNQPIDSFAQKMAIAAEKAGLDGVVCSAWEAAGIKSAAKNGFIALSPGIRFDGGDANDQERIATPPQAKELRCDYIVMGRPIIKAADPREAALAALAFC